MLQWSVEGMPTCCPSTQVKRNGSRGSQLGNKRFGISDDELCHNQTGDPLRHNDYVVCFDSVLSISFYIVSLTRVAQE